MIQSIHLWHDDVGNDKVERIVRAHLVERIDCTIAGRHFISFREQQFGDDSVDRFVIDSQYSFDDHGPSSHAGGGFHSTTDSSHQDSCLHQRIRARPASV
jgi:hypothetical protein